MSSNAPSMKRATDEAAQWFAKLNETSVSSATLQDFYAWRKAPDNDAAYRRIERVWLRSGQLSADPDIRSSLAGARARANNSRSRSFQAWGLGIACAFALICVGIFAYIQVMPANGNVFTTAVGEQRTIALADGSRIKLDTNSQIAVDFSQGIRSVVLNRGQAMFDVTHHADRPFEVHAGQTVIRDLGTRFDVRRENTFVQVTLVQGSVQVASSDGHQPVWNLQPGQQIIAGAAARGPEAVDASRVVSWTSGRLVFEDVTLQDATAEINRYAEHKVTLAADDVGAVRVTGTFDTNDPQAFASAVAKLYDLNLHRQPDGGIRLDRDAGPSSTKKIPDPSG